MNTTKRINFHLDSDLFIEVKIKLLKEQTNMTKVLGDYLKDYVSPTNTDNGGTGFNKDFTEDEYVEHMRKTEVSLGHSWTDTDIAYYQDAYRKDHEVSQ